MARTRRRTRRLSSASGAKASWERKRRSSSFPCAVRISPDEMRSTPALDGATMAAAAASAVSAAAMAGTQEAAGFQRDSRTLCSSTEPPGTAMYLPGAVSERQGMRTANDESLGESDSCHAGSTGTGIWVHETSRRSTDSGALRESGTGTCRETMGSTSDAQARAGDSGGRRDSGIRGLEEHQRMTGQR